MPLLLARLALPLAVTAFFVAVALRPAVGDRIWFLIVPAGVLIALRGVLMLAYPQDVLARLAEGEERSIIGRLGMRKEHPFGAVLAIVIGLGWVTIGLIGGFSA